MGLDDSAKLRDGVDTMGGPIGLTDSTRESGMLSGFCSWGFLVTP